MIGIAVEADVFYEKRLGVAVRRRCCTSVLYSSQPHLRRPPHVRGQGALKLWWLYQWKGCDLGIEFAEVAVRMTGEPGQYRAKQMGSNEPGVWAPAAAY
jgi:hypothetical protein